MRILQTIYRQLTRSCLGCPRYGAHWEELGFQGFSPDTTSAQPSASIQAWIHRDPGSVTHPMGLGPHGCGVRGSEVPEGSRVFPLSCPNAGIPVPFQNFPFCVMSVNITRMVLQALREERLSRECNRRQQVIGVLNDLHAAAFLRLSRLWKGHCATVADAAFVLKELELSTKRKPRQLLKSLEAYVSHSLQPSSPPSSSSHPQIHFTAICDPGVELEGESRLI
ncbi:ELMO domain containing 3 [Willisornis vidua]|uniref:ELMO domain containing 3 n=1 Tax=Willisornis vidua TaxID=1566151 RepID=A0ABQ9DWH4_9PASS|nr:ELMO domain containing 3 [Willisornis vidua]